MSPFWLAQVEALLLRGLSYTEIARELGIGNATVSFHARRLYKIHHVRGRANLERKLAGEADVAAPSVAWAPRP